MTILLYDTQVLPEYLRYGEEIEGPEIVPYLRQSSCAENPVFKRAFWPFFVVIRPSKGFGGCGHLEMAYSTRCDRSRTPWRFPYVTSLVLGQT